jgi:hypothetical protein
VANGRRATGWRRPKSRLTNGAALACAAEGKCGGRYAWNLPTISTRDLSGPACLSARPRRHRAAGPGVSPSSWLSAGTGSSASTAPRTCSPTRGSVSQRASSTSPSLTGCRCRTTPWTSSSARSPSSTSPASSRYWQSSPAYCAPAGDLVISDIHHELTTRGSAITTRGPAGEPRIVPTYRRQLGDYLRAALSLGLQVRRCEEPRAASAKEPLPEPATEIGDWQDWPFSLTDYLPSAARAAGGRSHLVIWHFQLPGLTALP